MIPLITIGLGGLVWYAQRAQSGPELDPGMSPALRREVLALSKRELTTEQLQSLVDEFGRAHYHHAQELFAARLRRSTGSAPASRQERPHRDWGAGLGGETNPAVLRRVAAVLTSLGQRDAAARVEAHATELESAAPPADLDELLNSAGGVTRKASSAELDELEAELGGLDEQGEDGDGDGDLDETEEDVSGGTESARGDQEAAEAAMDAAERAAKGTDASVDDAPSPEQSEKAPIETASSREPSVPEPEARPISALDVIETEGVEVSDASLGTRRKRKGRRRIGAQLGGHHGS